VSNARDGFDAIGVVVDWIDACKQRRLAARAKQQMEAQTRQEPGIMAFGGDGPRLFGN
jgi:hypothetical protein